MNALFAFVGRTMMVAYFALDAVKIKMQNFQAVSEHMGAKGVPLPTLMLCGAIIFMLIGSVTVAIGWYARIGALLLFIFVAAEVYVMHPFWLPGFDKLENTIQALKSLCMCGAMVFIMANGPGPGSFQNVISRIFG